MTAPKTTRKTQSKAPGRRKAPGGSQAHGNSHYRELPSSELARELTKVGAPAFSFPDFDFPAFDFPTIELPPIELPAEAMTSIRENLASIAESCKGLEETLTKRLEGEKNPESRKLLEKMLRDTRRTRKKVAP